MEQLATHRHSISYLTSNRSGSGYDAYILESGPLSYETEVTGGSLSHTHPISGTSGDADSLPPYYALALIMRIA